MSVDPNYYRGPQPTSFGQEYAPVYGSAAIVTLPHVYGGGTELFAGSGTLSGYEGDGAGSAAANEAIFGIVPAPNAAEHGNVFDALPRAEGVGSPIGKVTPSAVGEEYEDTSTGNIWIANGLTSSSWTQKEFS